MNIIKNTLKEEVKQIINIFKRIENQEIDKNFVKLCLVSITAIKKKKKLFFLVMVAVQLMLSTWLLN